MPLPYQNIDLTAEDIIRLYSGDPAATQSRTESEFSSQHYAQSVIPWEEFHSGDWTVPEGYEPIMNGDTIIGYMPIGGAGSATTSQPIYLVGPEPAPEGGFSFGGIGDFFSDVGDALGDAVDWAADNPLAVLNPGTYLPGASTGATVAGVTGGDIGEGAELGGEAAVIGGGLLSAGALGAGALGSGSITLPELGSISLGDLGLGDIFTTAGLGDLFGDFDIDNIFDDALDEIGLGDLGGGGGGSGINPLWSLVGGLFGLLGDDETTVTNRNVTNPIASPLLTGTDPTSMAYQGALQSQLNAPDLSQNPYFAPALQAAFQPVVQDFMTQILPGIRGQAVTTNNVGSSRQGIAEGMATDALSRNLLNAGAQAAYQFNQAGMGTQGQALDRLLRASGGTGTDQTQTQVTQLDPITQFLSGLTGSLGLISEYNQIAGGP